MSTNLPAVQTVKELLVRTYDDALPEDLPVPSAIRRKARRLLQGGLDEFAKILKLGVGKHEVVAFDADGTPLRPHEVKVTPATIVNIVRELKDLAAVGKEATVPRSSLEERAKLLREYLIARFGIDVYAEMADDLSQIFNL